MSFRITMLMMLIVFIGQPLQAEETPTLEMTGLRNEPITQTTAAMEFTGMASQPHAIQVKPPQDKK